ncbi:MAG: ABC transporter permease [Vicinamibacterales bacterium]
MRTSGDGGDSVRAGTRRDRVLVAMLLIGVWVLLAYGTGSYAVPYPWTVVARLWDEVFAGGDLVGHLGYTAAEAAVGFAAGVVPAVALPIAMRRAPAVLNTLDPLMLCGYGMPKLALAPLFILWFGLGIESKVAVVAVSVFFLVYFNLRNGLNAVDPAAVMLARVMGATERDITWRIAVPAAMPFLRAGVRLAIPYSIAAAVVAELISANRGLGYLLQLYTNNFDGAGTFAVLIAVVVLVAGANWGIASLHAMPVARAGKPNDR